MSANMQIISSPLLTWEVNNGMLEDVKTEMTLADMKGCLAAAKAELDRAERKVAAWKDLVAMGEADAGIQSSIEKVERVNKSERLRRFLRANRQNGVTYADIKDHFEEIDVPMGTNFTYNLINKWSELVERKNGKLFWKGD